MITYLTFKLSQEIFVALVNSLVFSAMVFYVVKLQVWHAFI